MAYKKGTPRGSFLVQVQNDQNATWQGTLRWIEKNENMPFRSTLELIKLIDSALESSKGTSDEEPDKIAQPMTPHFKK